MTTETAVVRSLTWKSLIAGVSAILVLGTLMSGVATRFIVPEVLEAARKDREAAMQAFIENPPRNFVTRDDLAQTVAAVQNSQADINARLARIEKTLDKLANPGK